MITLWGYFRSSAAYRLRIALNLKGIPYEQKSVHLAKGEHLAETFRALNPQALVPVAEITDATGLHLLIQSMAILEYLEEIYPSPALLPADPILRAKARAAADVVACDVHPLNNLRVLKYLRGPLALGEDAVNAWYRHWVVEGFNAIEALIEAKPDRAGFCFANAPSLADICLMPQIYNAHRFKVDLTPYPKIRAVEAGCGALKAFADAHPSAQPDAE